ncbi:MAG: peptidase M50 [Oscillospiraceae bacterium]|nr:peptidase M50 [Oscillospiraceae bacterium]
MSRPYRGPVRVSAGFCLLAAWFAAANGWRLLLTVLGAAAVHELGHLLVLRRLGTRVTGLRIGMLGAVLETDSGRLSYGGELLAVLAGPAANLLCALLLAALGGSRWAVPVGAHLVLGAFNLLPVGPLDGGRALYLLAAWSAGPAAAEWAVRWIGAASAVSLAAVVGWLMWRTGGSLWLLPAAAGLLWAAAPGGEKGAGGCRS